MSKFTGYFITSPKLLSYKFAVLSLSFVISGSIWAQDEKYYKGNLNTHSYWSDGDEFPEMILNGIKATAMTL